MKFHPLLRNLLLLAGFVLTALPAHAQYVNVQVYTNQMWHSEYGSTGGNCWETGTEEYTGLAWANLDGGGWQGGGCYTCDANGNCSMNPNYTPLNTNTLATTVGVRYAAWEDDGGNRCSNDSGDDCGYDANWSFTIRNLTRATWNAYNNYGNDDHTMNFQIYWNWIAPPAPAIGSASSVANTSFTANWSNADGNYRVTNYRLTVATDSGFANIVSGYNNLDLGTATSRSVTGLSAGQTYYYRVTAANEAGTSGVSSTGNAALPKYDQAITFNAPSTKTYGDAAFGLGATANSGLGVTYSVLSGPATINGSNLTVTGAGTVSVRASQVGNGSYNAAPNVDRSFAVNAKSLTITADAKSKTYGDADPSLTFSTSGLVGSDTTSGSLSRDAGSSVGSYAIRQGTVTAGSNYTISYTGANLTISAKALTVVGAVVVSKSYDATTTASITGTLSGVVAGDSVSLIGSGTFSNRNAGSGKTVTSTSSLGGAHAGNYTLTQPIGLTGTITARALTVSATGVNKVYDGATSATVTLSDNRIAGDQFTAAYSAANFADKNIGTGKTISVSGISIDGADAANYTVNPTASAAARIEAIVLTVTDPAVTTKTYDGSAAAAITGTLSGIIGGEDVSFVGTGTFGSVGVGSDIPVVSTATLAGAAAGNYSLVQPAGLTGVITPLTLTVSGAAVTSKLYDGTTAATITGTLNGIVAGDAVTFNGTGTFASAEVGTGIEVTSTSTLGGAAAGNYTLSQPTGLTGTITTRALTLTDAAVVSKEYDGTTLAAITGTLTGIAGSDEVTFTGTGTFVTVGAGTGIAVTSTSTIGGAAAANYALTQPTGLTGTITRKDLTITAVAKAKVYGQIDPALTYASSGLLEGDDITGTLTRAPGENAGTFAIEQGTLSAGENYRIIFQSAAFTISAKGLIITAEAKSKIYGGADPELTYTSTGLEPGDSITGGLTREMGENVGSRAITQGTLAVNGNYEIAFNGAVLTISPKALTVTAQDTTKVYGEPDPVFTYTSEGLEAGDGFTGALGREAGTSIGSYAITLGTLSAGSNYDLSFISGNSLTITTKGLTLGGAAVASKLYDGTTDAVITGTLSGVVGSDDVTFVGAGTFASAAKGTGIPVTPGITLDGADVDNYTITQPDGLTGNIFAGRIVFSPSTYYAAQSDGTVTLTLVRDGGPAATVSLRSDDGTVSPTFSPAVAGTDYADLDGTVISFADGEISKPVTVTLIPHTSANFPNRRFTVAIGTVTGGTAGDKSTATVAILAPSVSVTSPAANAAISDLSPFTLTGLAGDVRGISRVTVALDGAAAVDATLGSTATPSAIPWSLSIEPSNGSHTIEVTAFDLTGVATSVSRSFTFTRRHQLTVNRTGPAAIALDTAGNVTLTAGSGTASSLIPITANANPRTSKVVPGATLTLTAAPKTGYIFTRWTGLPTGATSLGNVATFTMPSADVEISAGFQASDVFNGPAGSGNTFLGLLLPDGETATGNGTVGYLSGTLSATGAFSGRVLVDGITQPVTASFFGDGSGVFTVGAAKQSTLTFGGRTLSLSYNAGEGNDAISATLTNGAAVSTGVARRAIYSAINLVSSSFLNTALTTGGAITRGTFTVALPSKEQSPARDASTYPQGEGYVTLTLTNAGAVTGSGVLADGTAISLASALVSGNQCPIFVQMATPGQAATVKGGSFLGTLVFDTTQTDTDVAGTGLTWIRPDVSALTPGTTAAAIAAANLYTTGWPSGIDVDAVGALYDKSKTVQASLDLNGASVDVDGSPLPYEDGNLVLANGKLSASINKRNFIVAANKVTKIPATDTSYTLVPVAATGAFTGTFRPDWTPLAAANPVFRGILIQKGANQGGHGFFLSNATGDTDPEAGDVSLTLEPQTSATPPVLTSTPSTVSATAPYTVKGAAGDARGLARVEVTVNGGEPVNAVLGTPSATGSVPYSLLITPALGSNTIVITAVDLRGNRSSTTLNLIFNQRFILSLNRSVPSSLPVDSVGTVALTVSPAAQGTALVPTAANSNPRTSQVQNGAAVTVTATAKTGYAFDRWIGLPAGASTTGNIARFAMPTSDLTVTAEFVASASVFAGAAGSGNGFFGLIRPEDGTATSNSTVGFLTGTLNSGTGGFIGSILIDGVTQAINATFYGNGSAVFTSGATKQNSLTFGGKTLTLSLNTGAGNDEITATVTAASATSTGAVRRAIYSASNAVPAALMNSGATGFATMVFPSKEQSGLATSAYPQGDGFATVTITTTGGITVSGTLADNTTFLATSALVDGDECPVFAQILTPGSTTARGGSFSGLLKFDTNQADSDLSGTDLVWIRPEVTQLTGTTAAALATQIYTQGWPNGVKVDALGALYSKSSTIQASLGLGAVNSTTGNGKLQFGDGKLIAPITKTNFNVNGSVVTKIPASDTSFTLTATAATGAFSGTIRPNWTPTATALPAFKGIILQKGANQGGFGFFLSNIPSDSDPESGGVSLGKP